MSRVVCKAKLKITFRKLLEIYPKIEEVVSEKGIGVKPGADDESGFEVKSRYYSVKNYLTGCVDELYLTNDLFTIELKSEKEYYVKEVSIFKFINKDNLTEDQWNYFQNNVAAQIDDEADYILTTLMIDNLVQSFRIPKSNIGWY